MLRHAFYLGSAKSYRLRPDRSAKSWDVSSRQNNLLVIACNPRSYVENGVSRDIVKGGMADFVSAPDPSLSPSVFPGSKLHR
jgi:hypothetical protein